MKEQIFEEYISLSKKLHMPLRKSGSAALELHMYHVVIDGYWQRELNFGILLLSHNFKEAGGLVEIINNKKMRKKNIFASNSIYMRN